MKNIINYFYNMDIKDIHQNQNEYYFKYKNNNYILQEYKRTNEELYEIYNLLFYLYSTGVYFHEIVLNNKNEILTDYNDKKYILMKVYINDEKKVELNDIMKISNVIVPNNYQYLIRNDWKKLWTNKIDYIEFYIDSNKYKYRNFAFNIDYFIGLVENAIQLLDDIDDNNLYLSHQRIKCNMKVRDLYNPLNIILDNQPRDICEFYKDRIVNDDEVEDVILYINNMNNKEKKLFFIRLLYMTNYFDVFDMSLNNNIEINELDNVLKKIPLYEERIKEIYNILYKNNILPEIEWIKKQVFKLV